MEDQFIKVLTKKYPDLQYSFSIGGDILFVYNDYIQEKFEDYCVMLSKCIGKDTHIKSVRMINLDFSDSV